MSSREEFLRAMGISQSDMMNPDADAPPTEMRSAPKKPQPSLRGESMKSSSKSVAADGAGGGARSMYDSESSYSKPSTRVPPGERQYGNTQEESYAPGPKPVARANSNVSATGSQEVPAETFFSGSRGGASSNSFSGSMNGEPTATPKRSKADLQKEADQMKNEGNEAFQRQEFRKAIRCYSKAIECDPTNAALYSNRSAAYLAGAAQTGMDIRSMALRDAVKATELRPDWPKAYCRQAEALIEMERHREAQEAYEAAYRLDPSNDLYKENALKCQSKANPTGKASSAINPTLEENLPRASASCSSFTSVEERKCSARELQSKYLSEDGGDIFRGNEYRAQELERLRQRKSCGSLRDSGSTPTPGGSSASTPTASMGSSGYFSAARNVPREYSSDAAKAYQQNLLEEYRRRKAQGKAA